MGVRVKDGLKVKGGIEECRMWRVEKDEKVERETP